jgi:hypothetical protein
MDGLTFRSVVGENSPFSRSSKPELQAAFINLDYLHEASFGRGSISIRVVGG